MPHANAALTELGRLRLARCIVEEGWSQARAAERFQVSRTTAARWAARYRQFGSAGMADRSSRPHRCSTRTPAPVVRRIVHVRLKQKLGPAGIGARLGLPASTVHAVLRRCRLSRLRHVDRASGMPVREPVHRYEHEAPGQLVHVDIKKLGNVPAGGGHRVHGRQAGRVNSRADKTGRVGRNGDPAQSNRGYGYVHTAVDDHSRLAYAEIHDDETAQTAAGFWRRAQAWFAARGVPVQRVLTDNGSCYRSRVFRATLSELGIVHKRTRPYRPQTNGKVERLNRTLLAEWAYQRLFTSETARRAALPARLHWYNHHRPHTALAGQAPITRCPNLPGQYT